MLAALTCLISFLPMALPPTGSASQKQSHQHLRVNCSQPRNALESLIREAEKNRYTTRRVELLGNTYTRDMVLRRKLTIGLQEGDLFSRKKLMRSLRNMSRLKVIYPVSVTDTELRLNRYEKTVDMLICVTERKRGPGLDNR